MSTTAFLLFLIFWAGLMNRGAEIIIRWDQEIFVIYKDLRPAFLRRRLLPFLLISVLAFDGAWAGASLARGNASPLKCFWISLSLRVDSDVFGNWVGCAMLAGDCTSLYGWLLLLLAFLTSYRKFLSFSRRFTLLGAFGASRRTGALWSLWLTTILRSRLIFDFHSRTLALILISEIGYSYRVIIRDVSQRWPASGAAATDTSTSATATALRRSATRTRGAAAFVTVRITAHFIFVELNELFHPFILLQCRFHECLHARFQLLLHGCCHFIDVLLVEILLSEEEAWGFAVEGCSPLTLLSILLFSLLVF